MPPALYQLEAKITCFGNHDLAIRASAHWKHSSMQNMPWKENMKPHLSENLGSEQRGEKAVSLEGGALWGWGAPARLGGRTRGVSTDPSPEQGRAGQRLSPAGSCTSVVSAPFTGPQTKLGAGPEQKWDRPWSWAWAHTVPAGAGAPPHPASWRLCPGRGWLPLPQNGSLLQGC